MNMQPQLQMYVDRMQEIVRRLAAVEKVLNGETKFDDNSVAVEFIYLQFRHVLELIAIASLSVNQQANKKLIDEGSRKWHAGDILEAVKTVNEDYYYPQPIRLVKKDSGDMKIGVSGYLGQWVDFEGDFLTRKKFTTLYSTTNHFLHTPNLAKPEPN